MKKIKCICLWFATVLIFSGCKDDLKIELPEKAIPGNYSEIFEAFWSGMNTNYLYWDLDRAQVDWDKLHHDYQAKFAVLNINRIEDLIKGKEYFREMTRDLSDGHLLISFNHPLLKSDSIFPARERNLQANHKRVSKDQQLKKNPSLYFDAGKTTVAVDPNTNLTLLMGYIGGKVLYFHFTNFYLEESSLNTSQVKLCLDEYFKNFNTKEISALILDLRNNSGGNVSDLNFFTARFVPSAKHFGYLTYKQGNNRLDYTPAINAYLLPIFPNHVEKPIYVLVNDRTISMAEISCIAMKSLPNVKLIGETTWGAQGLLVENNQLYNGGTFKVSDFMNVSMSTASLKNLKKESFEGRGIAPDLFVRYDSDGKDSQLAYAISLAKK